MAKKKAGKTGATRGIKDLPTKTLGAKQTKSVKAGEIYMELKLREPIIKY